MLSRLLLLSLAAGCLHLSACRATPGAAPGSGAEPQAASDPESARKAVTRVLDDWHLAASRADGARYFGHMDEEALFLGTDASERWTLPAFRAFCEPYFAKGVGWTYQCRERHVFVHADVAWFDERLWNDKYGECRGTGTLRRSDGAWKIVHYSLTLPVPNELAADVVKLIRGR